MSLVTNVTSITLKGTSNVETENGVMPVMTMSATVAEMGHSSKTTTIVNQQLYEEHKAEVRADEAAFIAKVQEMEDAGIEVKTE